MSRAFKKDNHSVLNDRFLCAGGKMTGFLYPEQLCNLINTLLSSLFERNGLVDHLPASQIIAWKRKILDSIFYLGSHTCRCLLGLGMKKKNKAFDSSNGFSLGITDLKQSAVAIPFENLRQFNEGKTEDRGGEKAKFVGERRNNTRGKEKTLVVDRASILVAAESGHMNNHISSELAAYYRVISATDGREAYENVVREHPDIVIADVVMPVMNGCDLLSLIKGNKDLKETSVILLCSRFMEDIEEEDIIKGPDEFLIKPFGQAELLARVRTQLELVKSRRIIKDQEVKLTRRIIDQKDRFISLAGHELKTPITSLQAYTELLVEKASTLDKVTLQKYLDKSKSFVRRLNKLVTDLLDVSRIKSGKMEYKFRDFNFRELVEENVELMRDLFSGHSFQVKGALPDVLNGDRDRLEQVLQNLLSNAVKYSPNGGTITVYCRRENGELVVSVKDEGIGVPDELKRKIFESYSRAGMEYQISGLGLGLFICATIVDRHGGRIWLESEVDRGSVFYFSLPLKS